MGLLIPSRSIKPAIHKTLLSSSLVTILALSASAASAADRKEEVVELEEIIVTSTKRSVSLQDVSSSISAFTTADIERRGLDNFEDFARLVPGLNLHQAVRNRSVFNIRGIATTAFGGNTQDPVSVYINETPVTDTFGAVVQPDLRLFDVERVEVLRGPQGTLFGSGSLGGTIRIITNQPDSHDYDVKGRVDIGVTEGGAWRKRYDGMVNIPLVEDQLALRIVGYYRDEEGWVENIELGTKNSTEDWGGRIAMRWTPDEDFSLKLEFLHQNSDPEDGDAWNPDAGKFKKTSAIAEARPSELTNYSLTMEYNIDNFASLISASSYQVSKTSTFQDVGDLLGVGLSAFNKSSPWDSEFYTQELRLVSNTDGAFEWIVGGFYIDRTTNPFFNFEIPGLKDFFGGIIPGDSIFNSNIITKSREFAGFADATYKLDDHWKLNAGIRVFNTKVSYEEVERNVLNFATLNVDTISFKNEGTDSDYTWRVGLSYEPQEEYLFYASVSRGYRIGQVNPNKGASLIDPNDIVIPETYAPDSTLNYEIGVKTSWLEGRLTANLAAYYIDWSDIQINGARISDMRTFITNAGDAESMGLEMEVAMAPLEGLDINFNVTVSDAKITDVAGNVITGAVKDEALPGSVDIKMSGGIQYSWNVLTDKSMYVRLDGQYIGSSPNDFKAGGANPFFSMNDAYENISLAMGLVAEKWTFTVYGENITNNDAYILTNGGGTPNYVNTLRPLTVGARLSLSY